MTDRSKMKVENLPEPQRELTEAEAEQAQGGTTTIAKVDQNLKKKEQLRDSQSVYE